MIEAHIVPPSYILYLQMVMSYGEYQPACAELKDTYCNNLADARELNPELFNGEYDDSC